MVQFPTPFLLAAASLIATTTVVLAAPDYTADYNGHTYEIYENTRKKWSKARDFASSQARCGVAGHLVTLTTVDEKDALMTMLKALGHTNLWSWFGLKETSEDVYEWIVTGENYTDLGTYDNDDNGSCGAINPTSNNGDWTLLACGSNQPFTVEFDTTCCDGTYNTDGECSECADGYSGAYCDPICSDQCATCASPGVCSVCNTGFTGTDCDSCDVGYTGDDCEPVCDSNCVTCNSPGICGECIPGYDGDVCIEITPSPTTQPSDQPSTSPSSSPSNSPSSSPSRLPTIAPSLPPSVLPSGSPSYLPSGSPSRLPTNVPSASPSVFPSGSPSIQPSSQPSKPPSSQPSSAPSGQPSSEPSLSPTQEYCQDWLQEPMLDQYYCGKDKYIGVKVPVCVAETKKVKSSKKSSSELLQIDPDGDGYYIKYETKCMKIDDIAELEDGSDDDKYIESCGCCSSGLEDENSDVCHNIFFHGVDSNAIGDVAPSPSPSMSPPSGKSGKSGKSRRLRRRRNKL